MSSKRKPRRWRLPLGTQRALKFIVTLLTTVAAFGLGNWVLAEWWLRLHDTSDRSSTVEPAEVVPMPPTALSPTVPDFTKHAVGHVGGRSGR
jgi:hypothetical protein